MGREAGEAGVDEEGSEEAKDQDVCRWQDAREAHETEGVSVSERSVIRKPALLSTYHYISMPISRQGCIAYGSIERYAASYI